MSTNYNHHIYNWLEKIESNIKAFKERTDATNEEKVEFITHQYHLVMIIHRVLSGHVIFVGAKPIEEVIEPEVEPVKKTRGRPKKASSMLSDIPAKKPRKPKSEN